MHFVISLSSVDRQFSNFLERARSKAVMKPASLRHPIPMRTISILSMSNEGKGKEGKRRIAFRSHPCALENSSKTEFPSKDRKVHHKRATNAAPRVRAQLKVQKGPK